MKSLVDGGSQLNVIRADVCESLNLTPVGEVSIRGVFGSPVKTQIVKLHVKLHDVDCDKLEPDYTAILCAVCPDLNEAFILTLPTADELYTAYSTASIVDCNSLPVLSSCAVTRSQTRNAIEQSDNPLDTADSQDASVASESDVVNDKQDSVPSFVDVDDTNLRSIAADCKFSQEQINDSSLAFAFRLAQKQKSGYLIKDGLLFRKEKLYGQDYVNLVVPKTRRLSALRLAHDSCHFGGKRTYERIITSGLTWGPSLDDLSVRAAAVDYASRCSVCQLHSRTTCYDRVLIRAVPREPVVFRHMNMDIFGEILPGVKLVHNYALVVVCSATRFPFAYPLRAPTTKNVCDALQKMFEYTGIPSEMVITCDNASYFKSALMREFQKRLGITPRYSTPWHPEGHALIERHLQTLQQVIVRLADEHKNNWTAYLGAALWAMRESISSTLGHAPFELVYDTTPAGPLRILRESWPTCPPGDQSRGFQNTVELSSCRAVVTI